MVVDIRPDRVHVERTRVPMFEALPRLDWEDFETTAQLTQRLVREFAADKPLFRRLVVAAVEDPYLWSKCEEDVVEDKIVLWDDIDKCLRVRLRISTAHQEQLAHCHRFSFTNLVLRGRYKHRNYESPNGLTETTSVNDVRTVLVHEDRAGDCFSIHHEALHSTPFTELGTISLVFRGNPVKERAPVMFKEARGRAEAIRAQAEKQRRLDVEPAAAAPGDFFWRVGEDAESAERRAERQMRAEKHAYWCERLIELGIV